MKATIWEVSNPDESGEIGGYRWTIYHRSYVIVSKGWYDTEKKAEESATRFVQRYLSKNLYGILIPPELKFKYDSRTNWEFLV